jgi:adenine deaminase
MAVVHGTVATVSDPHEIANVCGAAGVQWMIDNAKGAALKCFFGAPSCVPATSFETAGAVLDAEAIDDLLQSPDIWYLAEMMNYPGVLGGDSGILAKIAAAKKRGKPVDGHAPGLRGAAAAAYAAAGISTDHECTTLEEALDKIAAGMHILIREGSAAKNFEALHSLLSTHPEKVMLCSDDKHPDDLAVGHINGLVRRALANGHDLFDVLRAACLNPVLHYGLPVGLLHEGDPLDCIILPDLQSWKPSSTYVNGQLVAAGGRCSFNTGKPAPINYFKATRRKPGDFGLPAAGESAAVRVIVAHDGQLSTTADKATIPLKDGEVQADVSQDVLKLVVINRYEARTEPAIAFIRGFGFRQGAIASTVAHDCHNIIAVGVDDKSICAAVNAVIDAEGGISVASGPESVQCLPLPIAGLMSTDAGSQVAQQYAELSAAAKDLGSGLTAPFMTLSFMALLVIPALKLSDKGLFDGTRFAFTDTLI